jgi:hypothetical protein
MKYKGDNYKINKNKTINANGLLSKIKKQEKDPDKYLG